MRLYFHIENIIGLLPYPVSSLTFKSGYIKTKFYKGSKMQYQLIGQIFEVIPKEFKDKKTGEVSKSFVEVTVEQYNALKIQNNKNLVFISTKLEYRQP